MKIQLQNGGGRNVIRGCGPGEVTVNETVYRRSLVVAPDRIVEDWPPLSFDDLAAGHFALLAALAPEIILLGTGARHQFPAPVHTLPLIRAGIGLEIMDTAAACRTYNVILEDGRRVVAALLMI
jgi:uncharacterized protein